MDVFAWVSRHRDQALAAVLAGLYAAEVLLTDEVEHHHGSAALVGVAFAATLAVRRTLPLLPLLAAAVVIQLGHTVLPGLAEGGAFMVALLVSIFSAGSYLTGRQLVLAGVLVAGLVPLAALDPRQPPQVGDWVFFVVFAGTPFVAGILFRRRRERDEQMAALAEDAVANERARIARELHDVVAHAISVVVVQARGGRRQLGPEDEVARSAFDAIEHAGEQALVEMRRLLALLRESDDHLTGLAPQAGLGRLDALAGEMTASGLPVQVRREGDPVELPPGIDLSAYRIVQEALTNTLKHAGPARAEVVVRYLPGELELEVSDDGDGTGVGGGSGRGLAGVRERVDVYGGLLDAGRRPQGGFLVRARLPLAATT
ncbi:MAG TPA: histidine kinase [Nocardioides sp.]|nr:histidine kinase [Nocardioides sp.]